MLDSAEDSEEEKQRLRLLLKACHASGISLDVLEVLTNGLDSQAVRICCDNASTLPKNRKSKDVP
nr:hypothetical protein [uncultured Cohaesibacter sp.]